MTATARAAPVVVRDAKSGVVEVRLSNGLVALLLAQSDSPVVSVQTWYRVGSREETKGHTGLAHFLEHLLFKGTEHLRKGDIDLVTLKNGGQNNADTSYDRTRYWFQFAKDRWERALEIEADRMRGSAFDEYEFQAERGPVLEELRRDHDDPWWRLHEAMDATAYHSHPYHNPVIGWADEVTRVPREEVLTFYQRWYQPGNCTVVIVGGIDVDRAILRVEELFGPLPGGVIPEMNVPQEPPQEGERRFDLELEVQVPRMLAAFHTCRAKDPEDAVLDIVQGLLSSGKSSRLYDRLVRREGIAREISAWNDSRRDPGLFLVMMELTEGTDRARAEAIVWDEFEKLAKDGPTHDELERARSMISAGLIYRRATASGMAELIGGMHVLAGDWRLVTVIEARVLAVTADDVKRVVSQYLRRSNRSVGWCLPRPEGSGPRPSLPGDEVHELPEPPEDDRPAPEILRRAPPRGGKTVELPAKKVVLPNGLRLFLLRRTGAPILSLRTYVDGGMLREETPGAAAFAGECLDEGCAGRSANEISRFIESRGATMGAGALGGTLRCITRDAKECVATLADVVLRPDFPADAVEKKRAQLISEILAEDDDPAQVGRLRLRAEVYSPHPYGRRDKGSAETLRAMPREALLAHHRRLFVPSNAIVGCVGDLPVERMEELIAESFGGWKGAAVPKPQPPAPRTIDRAVDIPIREDRDQLHIFMGHLGIRRNDPDYHALLVGDLVLGSGAGFTDRLSKKLRDEMGLAYSVSARIARNSDIEPGMFSAYIGTSPQTKDVARDGMLAEIRRFVDGGPTADEVDDAKSFLLGSYVFAFETSDLTAENLVQLERLGLGLEEPANFARAVGSITAADVKAAVQRHIFPDRLVTVTVGRV